MDDWNRGEIVFLRMINKRAKRSMKVLISLVGERFGVGQDLVLAPAVVAGSQNI